MLTRKQQRTAKKISADRPLKIETYAKDIEKPGFFLKLLGFNPEVLSRNPVFASANNSVLRTVRTLKLIFCNGLNFCAHGRVFNQERRVI
ncbi:hypothetical protein H6F71_17170 [Microcoleus sp. FACHB-61]|nr:hypothetical protein [Microcoleus sp. FACHB-61]